MKNLIPIFCFRIQLNKGIIDICLSFLVCVLIVMCKNYFWHHSQNSHQNEHTAIKKGPNNKDNKAF